MPGQIYSALPQPQQLAAAQAGRDLGEEMVAVEDRTGGQELAELLGAVGARPDPTEDDLWVDRALGRSDLGDRVEGDQAVVRGGLQDPIQERAAGHKET